MKTPLGSRFGRLAFFVIAVGASFLIGRWHGDALQEAAFKGQGQNAQVPAPAASNLSAMGKLTREQALQGWLDVMQNSSITSSGVFDQIKKETDPDDVPYLLEQIGNLDSRRTRNRNIAMDQLFDLLGASNPGLALSMVGMITNAGERSAITKGILGTTARTDPQAAIALLAQLPAGAETQSDYGTVFFALSQANLATAVTAAIALPAGQDRVVALNGVMLVWAGTDAQAALDWASSLPAQDSGALETALVSVGERQPELVAQYLDNVQDASVRNLAIQSIVHDWNDSGGFTGMAPNDAAAALDWLDQVATGDTYDNNVKYILFQAGKQNPAATASLLDDVTEPGVREAAIANLAKSWGNADPQAALAWVQTLPDSDSATRDAALFSIVNAWTKTAPAAAVAFVEAAADPSAYLPIAPTLVQAWAVSDPDGALAWTNSLPDGDTKNQALNNALMSFSKSDFDSAWTYAANLPPTDNPAGIMGNLVGAMAAKDPAQAADFLQEFPEGASQLDATGSVAAVWALQDPNAFSQWVNDLPPGTQHDAAISAALRAVQSTKLPAPERASLVQELTQTQTVAP